MTQRIALFIPCLIDVAAPETGLHMADLIEAAGFEVAYPAEQTCCGQPAFNTGYREETLAFARHFIEVFDRPEYDAVVAPSGSCVAMVKVHYAEVGLTSGEKRRWEALSDRLYEFTSFFAGHADLATFTFHRTTRVLYHDPCHLMRELGVTQEPRTLLRNVEGTTLLDLQLEPRCCGFGGTFAVKFPELSVRMTRARIQDLMTSEGMEEIVTADPSCLFQLRGTLEKEGITLPSHHIVDYLHDAWIR